MAQTNEESPSFALFVTGLTLGFFHVLTGPDHLSALACLSASQNLWKSFFLGLRWGIGHSFGLLFVGLILILRDWYHRRKDENDTNTDFVDVPDSVSRLFESFVGFFMIFLGVVFLRRAFRKRLEYQGRIVPIEDDEYEDEEESFDDENAVLESSFTAQKQHGSYHDDSIRDTAAENNHEIQIPSSSFEMEDPFNNSTSCCEHQRKETLAFLAGIIHGFAGPGGVLGVIPAVKMENSKLASVYLLSFCIGSTFTMGIFAASFGCLSLSLARKANLEYQIHCISAASCILVGITWLVLLSMGKLEDVFP